MLLTTVLFANHASCTHSSFSEGHSSVMTPQTRAQLLSIKQTFYEGRPSKKMLRMAKQSQSCSFVAYYAPMRGPQMKSTRKNKTCRNCKIGLYISSSYDTVLCRRGLVPEQTKCVEKMNIWHKSTVRQCTCAKLHTWQMHDFHFTTQPP